jgi:hypothetical protein
MGNVHVINGILIYVYSRDHNPPHIHAFYAEYEALIRIADGQILRGYLPKKQLNQVLAWMKDPQVRKWLTETFHRLNPDLRP